ncbi:MAG: LysM peptidoglycan-binding domain-containing M23 family metallopeptidase [Candidatus Pacebacteria bacterium]|nr:LysM peptidoglycan-binding domain-containing M23 family metallopeptidase [Candidatus Paceibacterota bacterium]
MLAFIIPLSVLAASVYNHESPISEYKGVIDVAPTLGALELLDPAQTPDQVLAVGGGSIEIVDGIALRVERSPFGTGDGSVWVDTSREMVKYLVRPGDTIGHIAEMYGISAGTIRRHNDLGRNDYIIAGDVLEIPPAEDEELENTNSDSQDISEDEKSLENNDTETRVKVTAEGQDLEDYIFPCDCIVTQGYGNTKFARASSYYTSNWHGGVDFSSSQGTGTPLVAIASGTVTKVTYSGYNGGYGLYVKILHDNGVESLYAHNSKNIVTVGQKVEQGQIIGYMGTSGRVTGPHVHMELSKKENPFYNSFQGSFGY